jgi:hypothetical protein
MTTISSFDDEIFPIKQKEEISRLSQLIHFLLTLFPHQQPLKGLKSLSFFDQGEMVFFNRLFSRTLMPKTLLKAFFVESFFMRNFYAFIIQIFKALCIAYK